jgi:tripartite ATP-independent transporter DctM subunit
LEWWLILVFTMVGLLILLASGMPVAVAFLTLNLVGLLVLVGPKGVMLVTESMYSSTGSITFAAAPLFYFLGEILFQSKAIDYIFDAIDKLIGGVRARLNILAIMVGTVLGMLSGSALADSMVLGSTLLPEMVRRGYDKKMSSACIMCAGGLAIIIPPSVLAVITGGLANCSIARLLIAGLVPGLLLASIFVIYVLVRVRINPKLAPVYSSAKVPFSEKLKAVLRTFPFVIIILMVLGFILLGITTPTESAATGALGALIVAAFYKKLTLKMIQKTFFQTLKLSTMLLFIIASSKAFSQVVALSGATKGLLDTVTTMQTSPMVMLVIMMAVPFLLGCFLDQISIIMISVPIYVPLLDRFGFDPVWFWVLFLINLTVGGITPPFGLIIFAIKGVMPEIEIMDLYRGAIPFVFLFIFGVVLLTIFPVIALWLPNLVR